MPRIFISYRRSDSGMFTGRICDQLKASFGANNVFRNMYNISAGSDFRSVINEAVGSTDICLVIIGPQWLNITDAQGKRRLDDHVDFVRIEVEAALNNPETRVIPVLVDNAVMPVADDLPPSLRELAYRNAVKVRTDPDFPHDMEILTRQLKHSKGQQIIRSLGMILPVIFLLISGYFLFPVLQGNKTYVPAANLHPLETATVNIPTPTPTVEPVGPGEIMVLVAQIEQIGAKQRDVTRFIVDDLVNRFEVEMPDTNIRIREYKQIITSNAEALQVAEQTQAVLVIWGQYDDDSATVNVQLGSLTSRLHVALERGFLERAINIRVKVKNEREETLAYQILPALIFLHSAENEVVKEMSMFIFFDQLDAPSPELIGNSSTVHVHKAQKAFFSDKQLALSEISEAIKLEMKAANPLFYMFRGLLYQGTGDFASSDQDLNTALLLAPESWVMPYHIKGAQSLILNNLPVGIESYSKVIEKMPDDWYPYNQRGYLYFLAGQYEPAPEKKDIDYELAREDIDKAITLKPEMEWPYMWATLIALRQGRLEDASSMMSSMFQKQPNPTFVDLLLTAMYGEQNAKLLGNSMAAMGHLSLRQYDGVIQDTVNVLAVMPSYPEMYMLRGLSYCNLDNYADAEAAYTQGLTLDPSFTLLHLLRAEVRDKLGNKDGKTEDITAAQKSALSENLSPYLTAAQSGQFSCKQMLKTK